MDILIALITDINLFDESPKECLKHMNIINESVYYDVYVVYNNKRYRGESTELNFQNDFFRTYFYGKIPKEVREVLPEDNFKLSESGSRE
jgi:hypothetical protein